MSSFECVVPSFKLKTGQGGTGGNGGRLVRYADPLDHDQSHNPQEGTGNERYPIIDHPERPPDQRQNHGSDMVDGEADRHVWSDVLGVGHLLE